MVYCCRLQIYVCKVAEELDREGYVYQKWKVLEKIFFFIPSNDPARSAVFSYISNPSVYLRNT